jgi:hypothetical protein
VVQGSDVSACPLWPRHDPAATAISQSAINSSDPIQRMRFQKSMSVSLFSAK